VHRKVIKLTLPSENLSIASKLLIMKKFTLLGSILELVLPISIISWKINNSDFFSGNYGLFYYNYDTFFGNKSSSFGIDWISADGTYNDYFGDYWYMGAVILALIVVAFVLSLVDTKQNRSEILLLISAFALIILRLMVLDKNNLSFYESSSSPIKTEYSEIPLAALAGIAFSIIELVTSKKK